MLEEILREHIQRKHPEYPTYIGYGPIDVDDCQWVRASAGRSDVYFDHNTIAYAQYAISVRGRNNQEAKQRAHDIYLDIVNYAGDQYVILTSQLPRFVGRDQKDRAVYSFRLEIQSGDY